jgi:hypothetical protein
MTTLLSLFVVVDVAMTIGSKSGNGLGIDTGAVTSSIPFLVGRSLDRGGVFRCPGVGAREGRGGGGGK